MTSWKNRFNNYEPKQSEMINKTLLEIYKRAASCLPPEFIIISVSYQLFIEGSGEFQYLLAIAKVGDNDGLPEIVEYYSASFDKLPAEEVVENWVRKMQKIS